MPLEAPAGKDTRPTTDRIKETLFNILMPQIPGRRVLDLFAGSGGIGIEALSRGAAYCCFVDNSREAVSVIRRNLAFTKLGPSAEVLQMDAAQALALLSAREPFDIVFLDPPYDREIEQVILPRLASSACITEDTLIVLETSLKSDLEWIRDSGLCLNREKRYKTNRHLFLSMKKEN